MTGGGGFDKEIKLLLVAALLATISIVFASALRDLLDSSLQMMVPISEKQIQTPGYLFLWRLFFFFIILALLVALSIVCA
jgi:hypothetical protein